MTGPLQTDTNVQQRKVVWTGAVGAGANFSGCNKVRESISQSVGLNVMGRVSIPEEIGDTYLKTEGTVGYGLSGSMTLGQNIKINDKIDVGIYGKAAATLSDKTVTNTSTLNIPGNTLSGAQADAFQNASITVLSSAPYNVNFGGGARLKTHLKKCDLSVGVEAGLQVGTNLGYVDINATLPEGSTINTKMKSYEIAQKPYITPTFSADVHPFKADKFSIYVDLSLNNCSGGIRYNF